MKALLLLIGAMLPATVLAANAEPVVAITGGRVQGAWLEGGGAVFKGIPYAQPPVGGLRWREPVPPAPWLDVRDATQFAPLCAQNPYFGSSPAVSASQEDCLYLNVWVPQWPADSTKPVMVWIPGGGNFAGGSRGGISNGEKLSKHGVVVVAINYRLGLLGFFSHPALTRESPHHASGNQGLLDQIAALRWVRANIAAFGGDPSNVTIFGNSAASLDASVLMTSPLSKGLFQRVIGQSGAVDLSGEPQTRVQSERAGQSLASHWNLREQSLAAMRAVPTSEILKSEPDDVHELPPNLRISVDGYVVPTRPTDVFAAGKEHAVDLLIGNTSRDNVPEIDPPGDLTQAIRERYGPLAARALPLYSAETDPLYGPPKNQWVTDTVFRCPTVAELMWHAAAGNAAYEYQFDRAPPGHESTGAEHTQEMEYVFGNFGARKGLAADIFNATDMELSETIQQYWVNFAKAGDPNGGTLPHWPRFNTKERGYMEFTDAGAVPGIGLRRPFCDLFMEYRRRTVGSMTPNSLRLK
jgi:para-nitrobenzyl esterase